MQALLSPETPLAAVAVSSVRPFAKEDPGLIADPRVLDNLLAQNYFQHFQTDVTPWMRKVVTTWMLEVCEDLKCEDQVFHVAVNFLDRFLCKCVVLKTQLQLLGSTCLLLASKLSPTEHSQ